MCHPSVVFKSVVSKGVDYESERMVASRATFPVVKDAIGQSICVLTLLGTSFTILCYCILRPKNVHSFLVLNLAISDMLGVIGAMVQVGLFGSAFEKNNYLFCLTLTGIEDFLLSSTFYWTASIGLHLCAPTSLFFRKKWIFLGFGWVLPLLVNITAASIDLEQYRQHKGQKDEAQYIPFACSFKSNRSATSIAFFMVWAILYSTMIVCYIIIFIRRWRKQREIENSQLLDTAEPATRIESDIEGKTSERKILVYLLIFLVCWLPHTIFNLIDWGDPKWVQKHSHMVQIFNLGVYSQGFFNTIVYGFTDEIRRYLPAKLSFYFVTFRKSIRKSIHNNNSDIFRKTTNDRFTERDSLLMPPTPTTAITHQNTNSKQAAKFHYFTREE